MIDRPRSIDHREADHHPLSLVAQGDWAYGYDNNDRLVSADGLQTLRWQYDAIGNRTQQTAGLSIQMRSRGALAVRPCFGHFTSVFDSI